MKNSPCHGRSNCIAGSLFVGGIAATPWSSIIQITYNVNQLNCLCKDALNSVLFFKMTWYWKLKSSKVCNFSLYTGYSIVLRTFGGFTLVNAGKWRVFQFSSWQFLPAVLFCNQCRFLWKLASKLRSGYFINSLFLEKSNFIAALRKGQEVNILFYYIHGIDHKSRI